MSYQIPTSDLDISHSSFDLFSDFSDTAWRPSSWTFSVNFWIYLWFYPRHSRFPDQDCPVTECLSWKEILYSEVIYFAILIISLHCDYVSKICLFPIMDLLFLILLGTSVRFFHNSFYNFWYFVICLCQSWWLSNKTVLIIFTPFSFYSLILPLIIFSLLLILFLLIHPYLHFFVFSLECITIIFTASALN